MQEDTHVDCRIKYIYNSIFCQYIFQDFCFGGVMDKLGVQDFRSA